MTTVGIMLIITGTLLFLTKILKTKNFKISKVHALIIGLSQAFAVILEFQDLEPQFAPHFF